MGSNPVTGREHFASHLRIPPFIGFEKRQAAERGEKHRHAQCQQHQNLARRRKEVRGGSRVVGAQCLNSSVRLGFSSLSEDCRSAGQGTAGSTSSDWKFIRFFFIQRTA